MVVKGRVVVGVCVGRRAARMLLVGCGVVVLVLLAAALGVVATGFVA